jgi:hypothetical protein
MHNGHGLYASRETATGRFEPLDHLRGDLACRICSRLRHEGIAENFHVYRCVELRFQQAVIKKIFTSSPGISKHVFPAKEVYFSGINRHIEWFAQFLKGIDYL